MRLTLANVLELVVAAAAGMALARFVHHENGNKPFSVFAYLELIAAFLVLQRRVSRPTSHAAPSQLGEAPLAMGGGGFAIPLPPPLGPP